MRLLPLLALLAACAPDINVNKRDVDADGDGYTTDVDCDDAHASVNPDASEICDGLDNDCDTTIDGDAEDAATWYADADGDGHGDPDAATVACEAPADTVTEADDCDDADATAFPGATEVCDGADDDCDGAVDEDAADVATFYVDADGDGHGDPASGVTACEPGPDEVEDGTDCDDTDAAIHPDAAETDCADPVDYNCDGSVGYADLDGDRVAACEDCDDTDAARSPMLAEVCDAADVDEDCDAAADTEDPSADPATFARWYADADGDGHGDPAGALDACDAPAGYVASDDDCDDTAAAVSPSGTEVCDAADVDEDCDGLSDDADVASGGSTWYLDTDGDGYGDAAASTSACDQPAGYVTNALDCDDTASAVSPAGTEVCDAANVDEDCDGRADDSDSGATGQSTWYQDADSDAYGNAAASTAACDQPSGYVADATDCNDTTGGVHPGASEACDTANVDEDCDGAADDSDSAAAGKATWYRDQDGDTYGNAASTLARCDLPAGYVSNDDDCDDGTATVSPAHAEVCDGANVDEDCDGVADDDDTAATGKSTFYRDVDADTYGNVASTVSRCDLPSGYVTNDDDCDDTSASISPAGSEVCDASNVDEDCDGAADDSDTVATGKASWYRDADGDAYGNAASTVSRCDLPSGYVSNDDDCDDTSASISPADAEICDAANVDEDCDGAADDSDTSATGKSTFYRDSDADTYGNVASTVSQCDLPSGYVTNDDDCDDTSASISPADAEICDAANTDEDCDGTADDSDTSATNQSTWYRDADADTYGNATSTVARCDLPSGYVTNDDDCDDTSASISPADAEICDAANVDEDCDGAADDSDSSATGKSTFYLDADGDTYGTSSATLSRCDLPSGYVSVSTDCDDAHDDAFPGGIEVCDDDIDQDCSGADEECPVTHYDGTYAVDSGYDLKLYGRITDDWFGESLTAGDFDGDGFGDLVVGSSQYKPSGGYDGTVQGYYGPFTTGAHPAADVDDFGYLASTLSGSETFGEQVYNLGDLDDDGKDDLAAYYDVGDEWFFYKGGDTAVAAYTTNVDLYVSFWAYECKTVSGAGDVTTTAGREWLCGEDEYSSWRGAVYVHSGFSSDDTPLATLTGENTYDYAGRGVVTGGGGDVDGDGFDDILVGAPNADSGAVVDVGALYVVYGPVSGTVALASADQKLIGSQESEGIGTRVLVPGDVDGDGIDDLLLGAPYGGLEGYGTGAVYLVANPASGAVATQAAGTVLGGASSDLIGERNLDAGDFDGDGELDVLVGAYDSGLGGAAYAAYGPLTGTIDLATEGASWTGSVLNEYVGYSVAAVPDSDGDGKDEIAIGAILHDYTTGTSGYASNRGAVWVWLGE